MFFVSTAPSLGGHINMSPKGYDTFRILDDNRVCYLDLRGSGAETRAKKNQTSIDGLPAV